MTEHEIDPQDPQVLHRAAVHLTARNPGVVAELETRIQTLWLKVATGTAIDPLQEQA